MAPADVNRRCVQVKIVVCAKQVAVLGDEVEFTDDERDVDPDYLERALNEWDVFAVEEALRITEANGGDASAPDVTEESEVIVVTVGDEGADEALRRCLAMGADRAVRVEADGIEAADPLTCASRLAVVVAREDPDLVFCGVQSSDAVQAATGVMLAGLLDMACVAVVTKVSYDQAARRAIVHRELEGGLIDVVEVDTRPCSPSRPGSMCRATQRFGLSGRPARKRSRSSSPTRLRKGPTMSGACSSHTQVREPKCSGAMHRRWRPASRRS